MSVKEKMTAIADRLRLHNGTTDTLNLDEMVSEIDRATLQMYKVFSETEAFYGTELPEAFWDVLQIKGQRTDYSNMFSGNLMTDETFKPKYPMHVTNALRMFQANNNITDLSGVVMDFSECCDFSVAFNGMQNLVKFGDVSTISAETLYRPFLGCTALVEVGTFTVKEETTFNLPFANCSALEKITFAGVIGQELNIKWSPLNRASIENIIRCLSPEAEGRTLTLKSGIVNTEFETSSGADDGEGAFLALVDELGKTNWNISY